MNNIDLIVMSFKNLAKRKVRTCLTILSVIIGATSIIVMVSLGVALNEKFDSEIASIGTITTIKLDGYNDKIEKKDIEKIQKIENVVAVSPMINIYDLKLVLDNKYVGSFNVTGISPETMKDFGYEIEEGRLLDASDKNKYSIVFGDRTIYGFVRKGQQKSASYGYIESQEDIEKAYKADVLNGSLKLHTNREFGTKKSAPSDESNVTNHKMISAEGIGILKQTQDWQVKHQIFMPFEMVERLQKEIDKANKVTRKDINTKKGYGTVLVKVNSFENVENVITQIKNIFESNKKQISIFSDASYIESSKRLTNMIQAFLGAIGSISLFIAAIGITNTMIMSIYERTKEIGIMKVIGAKVSDIKKVFLLEATLIGFLGGITGVLFSFLISYSINKFGTLVVGDVINNELTNTPPKLSSIPLWLSTSSLLFTSLIGLIAGYLPARKVVKIEALKAIKSE